VIVIAAVLCVCATASGVTTTQVGSAVAVEEVGPRKSFAWLKMILKRRYTELAFPAYVAQGEPELVPVMHALASCITYRAAMKRVGMSQFVLTQARNRLAVMYRCFERWCRSAQVE
jgi:hypothetical protein